MKRLLFRVYAAQRLESFRKIQQRQQDEAMRGVGWLAFYVMVTAALLLAAVVKAGGQS